MLSEADELENNVEKTSSCPEAGYGPPHKLTLKSEFDAVKMTGRRFSAYGFIALISGKDWETPGCGIICSRKFDKRAVRRNRARRLLWEAVRLAGVTISPCGIVLIPKREILKMKCQDVRKELLNVLQKAGVIPERIA